MKKKLILGLLVLGVGLVMVPMFAAFEAHVINVSATIENALYVHPESRQFGTVFPEQYKQQGIFITFSDSFSATNQQRVTKVDYVIKQKPQCADPQGNLVQVTEDAGGNFVCPPGSTMRPNLCPWISKTPANLDGNDHGVPAFHDPLDPSSIATGTIDKNGIYVGDNWIVDLATPCFKGQCSQDWASFVHSFNPLADPNAYMANPSDQSKIFGCDLWIEVTKIY